MTVAALYVETNGVYYGLPDVDPWDKARDARLYEGPWPVVAHPPCTRWCRLAGTYGSPVRKRTWLYFVGAEPPAVTLNYFESRELFHDRVSWLNQPRGKGMSHGESSATPPAFRDVLLDMARSAALHRLEGCT